MISFRIWMKHSRQSSKRNIMKKTEVTKDELLKIKAFIEDIRFGSVTVIVQDGKVVQIEKQEKLRL